MKALKVLQYICFFVFCSMLFVMCKNKVDEDQQKASIIYDNLPFIEATVNGKKAILLIDTGASLSMLDSAFVANNNFVVEQNKTQSVRHIIGASMIIDCTKQPIAINGVETKIDFYITDLSSLLTQLSTLLDKEVVGILGCDYLSSTGAIIDISNKQFYILKPPVEDESIIEQAVEIDEDSTMLSILETAKQHELQHLVAYLATMQATEY